MPADQLQFAPAAKYESWVQHSKHLNIKRGTLLFCLFIFDTYTSH